MGLEFSFWVSHSSLCGSLAALWQDVVLRKWLRWVKLYDKGLLASLGTVPQWGLSFPLFTVGTVICLLPPGHAGWDDELAAWLHQVRHVAVMRVMLWPVSLQGSPRSGEMGTPSALRGGVILVFTALGEVCSFAAQRAFQQHPSWRQRKRSLCTCPNRDSKFLVWLAEFLWIQNPVTLSEKNVNLTCC